MTSHQLTAHQQQLLARLGGASREVKRHEGHLTSARLRQQALVAELHGLVPIAELVAVTHLTRQHIHRLARRNRTGGTT